MKQLTFFTFILIYLVLLLSACKLITYNNTNRPPSLKDYHNDERCYHNGKLTDKERQTNFPFNKAFRIEVISFDSNLGKTPIVNDTVCYSMTKETVVLSTVYINKLTDILYNYNYAKKTNVFTQTTLGCYYPRHAIIFLDKSDKIFSYIEICLECEQIKTNLSTESTGQFCNGKFNLLQEFFVSIGIKYYED